jgi:hypothetical protein
MRSAAADWIRRLSDLDLLHLREKEKYPPRRTQRRRDAETIRPPEAKPRGPLFLCGFARRKNPRNSAGQASAADSFGNESPTTTN